MAHHQHKRHHENWLWIVPLVLLVLLTPAPTLAFGSKTADRIVDAAGFVVAIAGALVRTAARSFKHEHGTSTLVVSGPYAIVRHPLYLGTFLCGLGVAIIHGGAIVILGYVASFALWHGSVIRREERRLAARWPQACAEYRAKVPMILAGPRRIVALLSSWPDDLRAAVIREADALFLWPMAGLAVRTYEILGARGREDANGREAVVLLVVTALLGASWLVVKHGLRRRAAREAG